MSWLATHLVKDYAPANRNIEQVVLPESPQPSPRELIIAVDYQWSALCCAANSRTRAGSAACKLRESEIDFETAPTMSTPSNRVEVLIAIAADFHHSVRPSSIHLAERYAPRESFRAASRRRRVRGLELLPLCREVSLSILNALTTESIGRARKILTMGRIGRIRPTAPTIDANGRNGIGLDCCKLLQFNALQD
jgi:hypothetical protein